MIVIFLPQTAKETPRRVEGRDTVTPDCSRLPLQFGHPKGLSKNLWGLNFYRPDLFIVTTSEVTIRQSLRLVYSEIKFTGMFIYICNLSINQM